VGKARNLRQRLTSYFQDPAAMHPRTWAMVQAAQDVDWVTVRTEVEALSLEYAWIKEFDPRFNVKYRDDKSYPYLAVTMGEEFPRVLVIREPKRKGTRYFGPYAHAWAIRDTVDELLKVFPMRSCRDGVFRRAAQLGRPCLLGYIGKCAAPCVGRVTAQEHRDIALDFCSVMSGQGDQFIAELQAQMRNASQEQRYEEAARLRDRIGALRRAMERNAVVFPDGTDADVIAIVDEPLEAAVQVFHVRDGRIRGERGFVLEKAEELSPGEYVDRVLQGVYAEVPAQGYPREVLVSALPESVPAWTQWLAAARGAKVDLRIPQRGDKRALMDTCLVNAERVLANHRLRRSTDLTARSRALEELRDALAMDQAPLRIECIDISTLAGQDTVASLVVFEDALPKKRDYRSFVISTPGADDLASVSEVVRRRFARIVDTGAERSGSSVPDTSFAYPPSLLVIDGGPGQVRVAAQALAQAGINDVRVIGLAKRMEEIWLPDVADPVILPRNSEGLYLLQRVRDEAHRFAISLHRKRRAKRQTTSVLDGISGLGPARINALLAHFGSMRAVRRADLAVLAGAAGIGPALAATIHAALHEVSPDQPAPTQD